MCDLFIFENKLNEHVDGFEEYVNHVIVDYQQGETYDGNNESWDVWCLAFRWLFKKYNHL